MDRKFLNVILLGFGFMFVFTAFQTMGNIEATVLKSITADDASFSGEGYTSLAIIYATLALFNWLAPSMISVTGPRLAMVLGSVTYTLFIASFLVPRTWLLYLASVLLGVGAAAIWTGQGNYLTVNSSADTISRNSGIFWAMLQCSLFFGNLFVFVLFQGKEHIDQHTRNVVFGVLTVVSVVGLVFLCLLRPARRQPDIGDDGKVAVVRNSGPAQAFRDALRLFWTKEMMFLGVSFVYTGVELSFFSGVYSASIGFTKSFGAAAKQLVGLSGVFIGLGEVIGGALFGILGGKTTRWGRDPIVIAGYLIHMTSFFLIFVNLPDSAPFGDTDEQSYIAPSAHLAMLCSFMLGFGDACYNTQIYSMLGGYFADDSVSAFALFKFMQSIAAAACFLYSSHLGLGVQIGILICLATLGTATFVKVEWIAKDKAIRDTNRTALAEMDEKMDQPAVITTNGLHID